MARSVVLFATVLAATVLAGACDAAPQRVEVGELQPESRPVEAEGADSAKACLRLAIGELDVGGGATHPSHPLRANHRAKGKPRRCPCLRGHNRRW